MTESREKAIRRTKNLAYWFMGEMLKEEATKKTWCHTICQQQ